MARREIDRQAPDIHEGFMEKHAPEFIAVGAVDHTWYTRYGKYRAPNPKPTNGQNFAERALRSFHESTNPSLIDATSVQRAGRQGRYLLLPPQTRVGLLLEYPGQRTQPLTNIITLPREIEVSPHQISSMDKSGSGMALLVPSNPHLREAELNISRLYGRLGMFTRIEGTPGFVGGGVINRDAFDNLEEKQPLYKDTVEKNERYEAQRLLAPHKKKFEARGIRVDEVSKVYLVIGIQGERKRIVDLRRGGDLPVYTDDLEEVYVTTKEDHAKVLEEFSKGIATARINATGEEPAFDIEQSEGHTTRTRRWGNHQPRPMPENTGYVPNIDVTDNGISIILPGGLGIQVEGKSSRRSERSNSPHASAPGDSSEAFQKPETDQYQLPDALSDTLFSADIDWSGEDEGESGPRTSL